MARLPRFDSRRPRAAVIIAWLAVIAAPAAAETVAPDRAREAARAVLSGGDYQRTLPSPLADAPDDRDADRRAAPTERRAITPRRSRPPEAMGDLARLLPWALAAIVGGLSIMYLVNEASHFRRRLVGAGGREDAHDAAPGETGAAEPRPAGGALDEADRLARDGAYGSAIHVMLLALVAALDRRIGRRLARSLTGREIAAAAGLDERPGAALSRIVARAELGHFGGRASSRADYEACRRDYAHVTETAGNPE